jgi:hypothetical protein
MWDPKRKKPADAGFFFSNLVEVRVYKICLNQLNLKDFLFRKGLGVNPSVTVVQVLSAVKES